MKYKKNLFYQAQDYSTTRYLVHKYYYAHSWGKKDDRKTNDLTLQEKYMYAYCICRL